MQTATFGTAGGSITATSNAGITYTLDVPPNALGGDVEISMAPVSAIANLPFTGILEGAVRLQPSGLNLLIPAVLTIGSAPTAGAERLVGFWFEGDADTYQPAGATDANTEIRMLVSHFSGAGAATGSDAYVEPWLAVMCASSDSSYPFYSKIANCWPGVPERRDWFLQYAREYLAYVVLPMISDDDPADGAMEYLEWHAGCSEAAASHNAADWETALDFEISFFKNEMRVKLSQAITNAKSQLCSQGGVELLRSIFEYRHLAVAAGLGDDAGLQESDVLAGLCAEVVITDTTLADPLPVGTDHSLDAQAELRINGVVEPVLFKFTILTGNATCVGSAVCGGRSNGLGEYTAVIRRSTSSDPVSVAVFASVVFSLFSFESDHGLTYALTETPLLASAEITRDGWTIDADLPLVLSPGMPATLSITVMKWEYSGGSSPLAGALVNFTVSGGTANPTHALTDANGEATTEITASAGSSGVVATATAWLGAVEIGSVVANRQVGSETPVFTFLSRQSSAYAGAGKLIGTDPYCPPGEPGASSDLFTEGSFTFGHNRSFLCPNPDLGPISASGSATGISDPGFSSGADHGIIYYNNSLQANVAGRTGVVMSGTAGHLFDLRFQVSGGPIAYKADAIVGGSNTNEHLNASLTMEGSGTLWVFNMLPGDTNQTYEGTLQPGIYLFHAVQNLALSSSNAASASNSSNVQVELGTSVLRASREKKK